MTFMIYHIFNVFPLNLHWIKNPHRIPTGPWGFITVPIPIPYPYPWESPWESPYPRQPCLSVISPLQHYRQNIKLISSASYMPKWYTNKYNSWRQTCTFYYGV